MVVPAKPPPELYCIDPVTPPALGVPPPPPPETEVVAILVILPVGLTVMIGMLLALP